MKKKLALRLLVILTIFIVVTIYYFFLKKGEQFQYAELTFETRTLNCKYIKFETPLVYHFSNGINLPKKVADYPQWLQFVQYTAYNTDISKQFKPEFFPQLSKDDYHEYETNWERKNKIYSEKTKRIESSDLMRQDSNLNGLLFLKFGEMEIVVFDFVSREGRNWPVTRKIAFFIENQIKWADNRKRPYSGKVGFLEEIDPYDMTSFISKLKKHPASFIEWSGSALDLDLENLSR